MDTFLLKMCRVCMGHLEQNFYSIRDKIDDKSLKIYEMIETAAPQLPPLFGEPNLSENICTVCLNKLNIAYTFQQMCITSDKRMRQMLQERRSHVGISNQNKSTLIEKPKNAATHSIADVEEEDDDPLLRRMLTPEIKMELNDDEIRDFKADPDEELPQNDNDDDADELTDGDEDESIKDDADDDSWSGGEKAGQNERAQQKQIPNPASQIALQGNPNFRKESDCQICMKSFVHPYRLRRHLKLHDQSRPYACSNCNYRFSTQSHLTAHNHSYHGIKPKPSKRLRVSNGGSFQCPECPRNFEKRESLSAHSQIHRRMERAEMFQCAFCPKVFNKIANLKKHASDHPEQQGYKCQLCDEKFTMKSELTLHLDKHDSMMKAFNCNFCDKTFPTSSLLKDHLRTHTGEKPYLCSVCGKSFKNCSNMRQHALRHSVEKRYQCKECPSKFACNSGLNKHMLTHCETKQFVCDICGAIFTRPDTLTKHKYKHTGERPHKCEECPMTFTFVENLRRHMRTHTGEKPYKCTFCDRAYSESGDLTKHMRIHVGENTYICRQCPASYKYMSELRVHENQHYKENQLLFLQEVEEEGEEEEEEENESSEVHEDADTSPTIDYDDDPQLYDDQYTHPVKIECDAIVLEDINTTIKIESGTN